MTHTLYYKLLLGYLLFGFLGFVTIATFSSDMTYRHLLGCLLYTSDAADD